VEGLFPVQPLRLPRRLQARGVYEALLQSGVRPVLQAGSGSVVERISFVISTRHTGSEIGYALASLEAVTADGKKLRGGNDNDDSSENATAGFRNVLGA
jgi:hypothetical protein